ncbi:hypothetical protein [Ralstonia phage P-PSG-11-1]|uniref:Uncharacterized protein n=1 Tax=Ralstonia phage P-PSG-11 TaxID=2652430 RepID=A0A5P8D4Z8_9CAUD|nr:hypothetical protein [Ralstonia phage P-PSG-11]QFP93759.1 hypothetical protein [Ralstonia phage P-PSG-11-1]
MKQWRKAPNQGAVRMGRKFINTKRVLSKFEPRMVNHGSILLQRLMLRSGTWAL